MPNPNVKQTLQDPGLGTIPAGAGGVQVKLGVSQKGTPNVLVSAGSPNAAKDALRSGPMLDALTQVLGVAGAPVLALPLTIASDGTVTSSFTLSGTGTGTVSGSRGPEGIVRVKIILGGTPGTMTYQVALGATGAYGPTIASTADPYTARVAGQYFTRLVFGNVTYVANDVYQLNLDGTITRTGSGPATALDGSISSPVDAYNVWVKITTPGALGAGAFTYSLDGGFNFAGPILIPAGGKYVIPNTGIVLTFSGTFVVDDIYTGSTTPAGVTSTEVVAGFTALALDSAPWEFAHVVGTPANAAAALTLASAVSAKLAEAEAVETFRFALIECPQGEGDSTIKTAFASFVDKNTHVVCTDIDLTSVLTGRRDRRNLAWAYSARLSAIKLSTHPGQVEASDNSGALRNVLDIHRDEDLTPGLDDARFVTARTIKDVIGFFITRGQTMAAPDSDYSNVMNLRVINRARALCRKAFLLYVNKAVRVDKQTGKILEKDALKIERAVRAAIASDLLGDADEASDVQVTVSRDDHILSTKTLNAELAVIPKGYSEFIKVKVGMQNPALQAV
jgi:hypothetical protein